MVSNAINGQDLSGVDRLLAVAILKEHSGGAVVRLFPRTCPVCDNDHQERIHRSIRIVKQIHPDAVPFLREARVPETYIREPRYFYKGAKLKEEDEERLKEMTRDELKNFRRQQKRKKQSLPVWVGDPDKTRAAQIAFAIRSATERGILLPASLRQVP
jgi:hypothetical protein